MPFGKEFHLRTDTLGIEDRNGRWRSVLVPAGAQVYASDTPCSFDPRLVGIRWANRQIFVFIVDLKERGYPAV